MDVKEAIAQDGARRSRVLRAMTFEPGEVAPLPWQFAVNSVGSSFALPTRARTLLYRAAGINVSLGSRIKPQVIFRGPAVTIGRGTTVNYRCVFDNRTRVIIGSRCGIGIGVHFVTSGHEMSNPLGRAGRGSLEPIVVGDGAWIGSGSTIMGGVTIGEGCVIGAGAIVTKDCDAHTLYVGVPARPLRRLPGFSAPAEGEEQLVGDHGG